MPTPPTFSRLDAADTRQLAEEMSAEVAAKKQQPRITNAHFAIALVVVSIAFAVFAYLLLW